MYLVFSFNTWHSGTGSISPWIPSKLMYLVFLLLRPKVKLLMIFVCFVFTACITLEMFSHFTFVPDKESLVSDAGKLHVLDSLLERLKNENHRVLIYSQMTRMIDLLEVSTPQSEFCFVLFLKNTDHLSLGIFCHKLEDLPVKKFIRSLTDFDVGMGGGKLATVLNLIC